MTKISAAEEAWRLYTKRFRIETFFSDQKSRGFHLHKSQLADPARLARLLMAACVAYIWIIVSDHRGTTRAMLSGCP